MKLEDQSREETERQQRCSRSKAQGYILLSRGGMGTPCFINKRAEEREFVVIQELVCIWSAKMTSTLLS